jgi:hypothetical protein
MYLRPLFWMTLGAGATLVAGAWGGRESLPAMGEPQHIDYVKTAVQMDASFISNSAYAAENALSRTPWVKPKADPFGEKPVVVRRRVLTTVENHEPPPLVFPFEYIGKLTIDGKETLYLSKGEQIYPVAEGVTLENLYRVEHTSNDSIDLSYLPDARKMTITLESITAKQNSGGANRSLNNVAGSIEPSPAPSYGGVVIPTPINLPTTPHDGDVPQTKAPSENEVLQQVTASVPPVSFSADGSLQSAAVSEQQPQPSVPTPPIPMPPGMLPPGMMPPAAPQ